MINLKKDWFLNCHNLLLQRGVAVTYLSFVALEFEHAEIPFIIVYKSDRLPKGLYLKELIADDLENIKTIQKYNDERIYEIFTTDKFELRMYNILERES
jgi:hypothetical protein